jgi:hypothetical protein
MFVYRIGTVLYHKKRKRSIDLRLTTNRQYTDQTRQHGWYYAAKLTRYLDDVPDLVAVVAGGLVPVLSAVTRNVPGPCIILTFRVDPDPVDPEKNLLAASGSVNSELRIRTVSFTI